MSLPTLMQTGLSTLLDSPIVEALVDKAKGKAVSVLVEHFTFTADEISDAYQKSFDNALAAISNQLAQKRSVLSAKLTHDFADRFAKQIEANYSQTFATSSATGKKEVIEKIKDLLKYTDKLFQIDKITETDLAALINYQRTVDLTDLLLEQMQRVAPVDDTLAAFFRHNDLLGKTMLFFLHEQFRAINLSQYRL